MEANGTAEVLNEYFASVFTNKEDAPKVTVKEEVVEILDGLKIDKEEQSSWISKLWKSLQPLHKVERKPSSKVFLNISKPTTVSDYLNICAVYYSELTDRRNETQSFVCTFYGRTMRNTQNLSYKSGVKPKCVPARAGPSVVGSFESVTKETAARRLYVLPWKQEHVGCVPPESLGGGAAMGVSMETGSQRCAAAANCRHQHHRCRFGAGRGSISGSRAAPGRANCATMATAQPSPGEEPQPLRAWRCPQHPFTGEQKAKLCGDVNLKVKQRTPSGSGSALRHNSGSGSALRDNSGSGSALRDNSGSGSALRDNSGSGSALRDNSGSGSALRDNSGSGSALRHNSGSGSALRDNSGSGSALRDNSGSGSALRDNSGSGSALRDNSGSGSALRDNSGSGSALRDNSGSGSALRDNSGSGSALRDNSGSGSALRDNSGSGSALRDNSGSGSALRDNSGSGSALRDNRRVNGSGLDPSSGGRFCFTSKSDRHWSTQGKKICFPQLQRQGGDGHTLDQLPYDKLFKKIREEEFALHAVVRNELSLYGAALFPIPTARHSQPMKSEFTKWFVTTAVISAVYIPHPMHPKFSNTNISV
ncbi:uncharacterized protein [Heptranchias perlo]|uniref:uncharacterized protein n=1 Tax=Heptranchias perlo TaxID=212740 RepID=UPI00355AC392